jgi:hypothetical protein
MEATFKTLLTLGGFLYPLEPVQPYHFQAYQIWCDGTFKAKSLKTLKKAILSSWPCLLLGKFRQSVQMHLKIFHL